MSDKEWDRNHIFEKVQLKMIKLTKAAEMLDISYRQAKRLWKTFKLKGKEGLISKARGKKSNRAIKEERKKEILSIITDTYLGCKPLFVAEKLIKNHGISLSSETVRKWLIEHNLWIAHKRKINPHQRRVRRECEGELSQVDASDHAWLENRGPKCHLHMFVDDATSKIQGGYFSKEETTEGYYRAGMQYFLKHGLPRAIYNDKRGTFVVNMKNKTRLTQFGRAMKELGIGMITAHSPQAKGRIERAFGTLQDRLVCEMRLRSISTIDEANKYLPEFIEEYNAKFGKAPACTFNAHRTFNQDKPLKYILCHKETRKVSKNLEISYKGKIYQILLTEKQQLIKSKINVLETVDGELRLEFKDLELEFKRYDEIINASKKVTWNTRKKVACDSRTKVGYDKSKRPDELFRTVQERGYIEMEENMSEEELIKTRIKLEERRRQSREDNLCRKESPEERREIA